MQKLQLGNVVPWLVLQTQHEYLAANEARCFENKHFEKDCCNGRF